MRFDIEVSKMDGMRGDLAVFWPSRKAKWYKHPLWSYPGERGRFLGGFNLGKWIMRAHAVWSPR